MDIGPCISACREKIAMGQRVGRCYVCVEELRQQLDAAERGLAEWQAKAKTDRALLEAALNLQKVPSSDFWKVYDDLRDIGQLAQSVSVFVDRIANMIPDAKA